MWLKPRLDVLAFWRISAQFGVRFVAVGLRLLLILVEVGIIEAVVALWSVKAGTEQATDAAVTAADGRVKQGAEDVDGAQHQTDDCDGRN